MEFISNCLDDTNKIAEKFSKILKKGDIIAYSGDLGSGKTAFSSALIKSLGYNDIVTSPTFAIVNEYYCNDLAIFHFDMYRILDEEALYDIGWDDYLASNAILLIEWSENIINALPKNYYKVKITYKGENSRLIEIDGENIENFSI